MDKKNNKNDNELSEIQDLPSGVQDFLLDPKRSKIDTEIIEKFDLDSDQEDLYFDLTDKIIFKKIKIENFLDEVRKTFNFDEEKSRKLVLEVLGNVFLPIDSYLGNVSAEIKKIGGDTNDFQVEHLKLQKTTAEKLTDEIIEESNLVLEDEVSKRRLKNIVVNKFNDVRDDSDTIEVITRGIKTGGMGLTQEVAERLVKVMNAKRGMYKISEEVANPLPAKKVVIEKGNGEPPNNLPIAKNNLSGTQVPTKLSKSLPKKSKEENSKNSLPSTVKKKDIIYGTEDEREIEHFKNELNKKIFIEKAIDFDKEVQKGVEQILKIGKLSFTDENQESRFLSLVSARLRDVRDKNETLELLKRDRSIGGLGLKEESAVKIMDLVEKEFEALNRIKKEGELKKIDEWKKQQEVEKSEKENKEKNEETNKIQERWTKLTGKTSPIEEENNTPKIPEKLVVEPIKQRTDTELTSLPQTQKVEPISEPEPKIQEQYTSQLTGPIEELRSMSITDFRRISDNPERAIEKIQDKIELLEDESYTKKIQGIMAWQESEPSKIYFEILNKSINEFIPINDILANRAEKKLPSLSQEEFNALLKLNKALRV